MPERMSIHFKNTTNLESSVSLDILTISLDISSSVII